MPLFVPHRMGATHPPWAAACWLSVSLLACVEIDPEYAAGDTRTVADTAGTRGEAMAGLTSDSSAGQGEAEASTSDENTGPDSPLRRVFITSAQFDGNLGGVVGADGSCQMLADMADLGGLWRAFLADPVQGMARHSANGTPYERLDGVVVALDWADLTDGSIAAPLNLDERGMPAGGIAWTGLFDVVGAEDNQCASWTFAEGGCLNPKGTPCGSGGDSSKTDASWDGEFIYSCNSQYRLYCIEQ